MSEIGRDSISAAPAPAEGSRPAFAHESEAELARILDFYAVRWEYEPHTFPILWNLNGDVLESFSPDFYLSDLDLYVELTTLRQRLVRKKNRKLRWLRELYPDVRIKLFYARDFRALMLKYGKLGLADALSGAPGQVVPPRAQASIRGAAGAVPARASIVNVGAAGGDPGGPSADPVAAARAARRERKGRRSATARTEAAVETTRTSQSRSVEGARTS